MTRRTLAWIGLWATLAIFILFSLRSCSHDQTTEDGAHDENEQSAVAPADSSVQRISQSEGFALLPQLSSNPIEFFGLVIDEEGKPIPNVQVTGRTGSKTGFMSEEHRSYETTTDEHGEFVFEDFSGAGLAIEVEKNGYLFQSSKRTYNFSSFTSDRPRHEPDPDNPVVFQMWERWGAEPMIHYQKAFYNLPIDGTPVEIDLFEGKKVEAEGDLRVQVWCDPNDPTSFDSDWKATVAIPDGGLIQDELDWRFHAPINGYTPEFQYVFDGDPRESRLQQTFTSRIDGGRAYARLRVAIQNNAVDLNYTLRIRVWLNPTDSRNLEYDPMLQLTVE